MVKFAKKFLLIVLMLFTTITFCACSTTRLETIFNDDGSIEERLYVTIDKGAVGENFIEVRNNIISLAQQEVERERSKFLIYNVEYGNDIKPIKTEIIDDENFMIGLWFADSDCYNAFYNLGSSNKAEYQYQKHFLYTKVYKQGLTMLTHPKLEEVYNRVEAKILNMYPEFSGMEKQNEMRYTMIADLRREKSNADIVQKINGKYYHTWVVDMEDQQPIEIYYIVANRSNWILICLGVVVVVCAILCAVGLNILNKQKRKSDESKSA